MSRIESFNKGDKVRLSAHCQRQFPSLKGRSGWIAAQPRLGRALPMVAVRFAGYRTARYFHADFVRHKERVS